MLRHKTNRSDVVRYDLQVARRDFVYVDMVENRVKISQLVVIFLEIRISPLVQRQLNLEKLAR